MVEPGDVGGMPRPGQTLLEDRDVLAAARKAAERAREELTWEALRRRTSSSTGSL